MKKSTAKILFQVEKLIKRAADLAEKEGNKVYKAAQHDFVEADLGQDITGISLELHAILKAYKDRFERANKEA